MSVKKIFFLNNEMIVDAELCYIALLTLFCYN